MSSATSQCNPTPFSTDPHPSIPLEDLDFLDAIDATVDTVDAAEVLGGDTQIGRPTSGKPCGKASELIQTLATGEFHQIGSCPFCPAAPSPKGKGTTVLVDAERKRLTLMCWAPDEHDHSRSAIRTTQDGRDYACWSWSPNAKMSKDTIPTDDQSYLADHILRVLVAKQGLLAIRNEQVYVYDSQSGKRAGGKSNAGCSPTWGAWAPLPATFLDEFIRRELVKLSVRVEKKDGTEGSRPVRVTVRLIADVQTLLIRTLQMREYAHLEGLRQRGTITTDEREAAASRFDLCTATLLNPGTVLTERAKQEIARPDHYVTSDARIGFAPDRHHIDEWAAYVAQMVPDFTDRVALQMWVGAAVVGACATKLQQHAILLGAPGTGKSQLIELVASIFPSAQRSAVPLARLADRFSAAGLVGKRFNTSPEADSADGKLPDIGALKMILDGSTIQVERKNQQAYWARLTCAHLIAANDLPSGGAGEAIYDRFRVIKMTDKRIRHEAGSVAQWWTTKLHWRPAILAWAIEGLAALDAAGWRLPKSAASTEATDEWREAGDSVFAWVRSLPPPPAETDRQSWAPAAAAYAAYSAWCRAEGRGVLQNAKFGARIKELAGHTRTGGRAYQITITKVDPAVSELFPTIPTVPTIEQQILAVWEKQDAAGLAVLAKAHPAEVQRVILGRNYH